MVLLLPHAVSCLYNGMTFKALENWTKAKLVFEIAGWNGVLVLQAAVVPIQVPSCTGYLLAVGPRSDALSFMCHGSIFSS